MTLENLIRGVWKDGRKSAEATKANRFYVTQKVLEIAEILKNIGFATPKEAQALRDENAKLRKELR